MVLLVGHAGWTLALVKVLGPGSVGGSAGADAGMCGVGSSAGGLGGGGKGDSSMSACDGTAGSGSMGRTVMWEGGQWRQYLLFPFLLHRNNEK